MQPRIYKTKGPLDPLQDRDILVERKELWQIVRLATQPNVYSYGALLSPRQTGKTTLLYHARATLVAQDCGVAFVDLSPLEGQADQEACYQFVCKQILADLSAYLRLQRAAKEKLEEVNGPISFRRFLEEVAQRARPARLVILLDEVKAVPEGMASAFYGTIRSIFTSRRKANESVLEKYVFILSGANELYELTNGDNSPLNICEKIYLTDLDSNGVWQIARNLRQRGCQVSRQASDYLYRQTRGHPYLTQRICSLLEIHQAPTLTPVAIDEAISEIQRGDDNLEHLTRQLDRHPEARELMRDVLTSKEAIPFSRVNPTISRLEMIGAVADSEACRPRNPIYERAMRHYLRLTLDQQRAPLGQRLIVLGLILLFLLPAPTIMLYLSEVILSDRYVNQRIQVPAYGVTGYIRYDLLLAPGESEEIEVELERSPDMATKPLKVSLRTHEEDLASADGRYALLYDTSYQSQRFAIHLQKNTRLQDILFPFLIDRDRHIDLYMEQIEPTITTEQIAPSFETVPFYTATLKLDFVSSVVGSLIFWLVSFAAGARSILNHLDTLGDWGENLGQLLPFGKKEDEN